MLKCVHSYRNLRVWASSLNGQRPAGSGKSLLFRLGTFSDAETRSQAQKPAREDPEPKWPKTGHLGLRPLMFRFLSGPVCALLLT